MDRRSFITAAALSAAWHQTRAAALSQQIGANGDSGLDAALRARLSADPLRPQFHLLPVANWMNDPCAPRFFAGQYHVFFQYNPGAAVWGDMHWAHATSTDLVHWTHRPVALEPTPGGPDAAGCFTGSVFPGVETPTIIYTGVTSVAAADETIPNGKLREVQCMATADGPALDRWTKLADPVLPTPPPGLEVAGFRDPCPWREGNVWYLAVGSGFRSKGGAVLLYRSMDGRTWEYLHPLTQGKWNGESHPDPVDSGEMWECPDFFPLGGEHVLLYSSERKVFWQTGRLDRTTMRFQARQRGMLDLGAFYAPKSMLDAAGRRILWGWVPETRPVEDYRRAGWAGMMALPRLLTLAPDGRLQMEPISELAQLLKQVPAEPSSAAPTDEDPMERRAWTLPERQGRVRIEMKAAAGPVDLRFGPVNAEEDAPPMLELQHRPEADPHSVTMAERRLALRPNRAGISVIDVWMDGSVAEIFIDRVSVMTQRVYVRPEDALQIACAWGKGVVSTIDVSEVRPISRDRLTS